MSRVQGRMSATSRVLTLFALLAGLLAMHGLAGGAHAAHAAAAPIGHAAADMAGEPTLMSVTAAPVSGAVSSPPRHGGSVMVAMVLCLVVLVAVGMALLAPALRSYGLRRTASPVRARPRATSSPRGPPPDLLSQLCVLRT